MKETQPLAEKVALVTGGGRGIGRATAIALARAGAHVAVGARSVAEIQAVAEEIQAQHGTALAIRVDVADPHSVEDMLDTAWTMLGPVDILVNNAGVIDPVGKAWEVPAEEWLHALSINLGGPFLCAHFWLKRILQQGKARYPGRRIINISTGAAERVQPGCSAYCATKAGVDHFTRVLAAEVAAFGITVHAVYPGMVDTQMMARLRQAPPQRFPERDRFVELWREGQLRAPEEISRLVVWLSSGLADDLNGAIIRIDDQVIRQRVFDDSG